MKPAPHTQISRNTVSTGTVEKNYQSRTAVDKRQALAKHAYATHNSHAAIEHSCGAIVYRSDLQQILMIKERFGKTWGFPKGHVEQGEQLMQTARREILEETGVHVRFIPGFTRSTIFHSNRRASKRVTFFVARATSTTLVRTDQIASAEWVNIEEAFSRLRFANTKKILEEALKQLSAPVPKIFPDVLTHYADGQNRQESSIALPRRAHYQPGKKL